MTESELAVNTNSNKSPPTPDLQNNDPSLAIMNLKNKFDSIRLENKINNDEKEKKEPTLKDIEAGPTSCDLCDFETAISATGYGKYNCLIMFSSIFGFLACINATSTMSLILPSAECDLSLTNFDKGILNAIIYVGMITSAFFWGFFSDTLGRKRLLVIGFALDALFSIIVGLSQNFTVLLVAKLFSGFICSGPYAILMTYLAECHAAKFRPSIIVWTGIFSAMGTVSLPMLAWLIIPQPIHIEIWDGVLSLPSWRVFLIVSTIPSIIASFVLNLFDESPKFLMFRGRRDEAMEVFKKIYWINTGKPKDTFPIKSLLDETQTKQGMEEDEHMTLGGFLKLGWTQCVPLFKRPHLPYAALVFLIQFGTLYGLNTIRLWTPQLFSLMIDNEKNPHFNSTITTVCQLLSPVASMTNLTHEISEITEIADVIVCGDRLVEDRVYINQIIIGATTGIGYLTSGYLVRSLGKIRLMALTYGIAIACCFGMYWSITSDIMLGVTAIFITMTSVSATAVVSVVVDLFPTSLRTMAVSLTMMFGRTGAMMGNLVFPLLLDWDCTVPFFLLSAVMFVTGAITFLLPKTKGKALE